jgi:hypothetical protein
MTNNQAIVAEMKQTTSKRHYFQHCIYKTRRFEEWQQGIAKVEAFDLSAVDFIIAADGKKVTSIYDYELMSMTFECPHRGIVLTTNE